MAACSEHQEYHALIAPSDKISLEKQSALSKLQAKFRGGRDRVTHISRLREGKPICPFLRTPANAVTAMLEMGKVGVGDTVFDLGCGDGVISLAAARAGAKVTGFDIDQVHLSTARRRAAEEELKIEFRCDDIFEMDYECGVLVMFLVPNMLEPLRARFKSMPAGTRILSYHFPLPAWEADQVREVDHPHHAPPATSTVYLYVVT